MNRAMTIFFDTLRLRVASAEQGTRMFIIKLKTMCGWH